jgi:UDP-N-acetylmuramoyl-L-alanyl-D-glutamate--2,6-diaminopimelate ligase
VITVGKAEDADLHILDHRLDATGQTLRIAWQGKARTLRLNVMGQFQAENALVAAGMVIAAGGAADEVFDSLAHLKTVRGRMELAATRKNGAPVFVDYAHTPDAVRSAIASLRGHIIGKLVAVIGAGGDRDTAKRPLMGAAAAAAADVVIVTDDNPRSEDPAAIRAAVMEGCP